MEQFSRMVRRLFSFLVDDYGFRLTSGQRESSLDSITYEKKPILIEFGWYKGEIDINIRVDVENEVFRPYRSRAFALGEIALRQDKDAYRDAPKFPDYITTSGQAKKWLRFEAGILRRFCAPILRGDLRLLEEITLERNAGA